MTLERLRTELAESALALEIQSNARAQAVEDLRALEEWLQSETDRRREAQAKLERLLSVADREAGEVMAHSQSEADREATRGSEDPVNSPEGMGRWYQEAW